MYRRDSVYFMPSELLRRVPSDTLRTMSVVYHQEIPVDMIGSAFGSSDNISRKLFILEVRAVSQGFIWPLALA